MLMKTIPSPSWRGLLALHLLCAAGVALGQASPYRGLWIGTVSLRSVNEVAIPLDESNIPIAPDPRVPTPTFDEANLRLLIHVNGAGQASLLKDVAILNRQDPNAEEPNSEIFAQEKDLALVTDPRVYSEFPPQAARRFGSAVFDFGDAAATEALDALVAEATRLATDFAMNPGLNVANQALRVQARQVLSAQIVAALTGIADKADVAEAFNGFIAQFNSGVVDAIAADPAGPEVAESLVWANDLKTQSFYGDERAIDMVNAVVAAVEAAAPGEEERDAQNAASAYADVQNLYQRFISGRSFGTMLLAAAAEAGIAAKLPGASAASIETAIRSIPESTQAILESVTAKVNMYSDTRSVQAINQVLAAMALNAYNNRGRPASDIVSRSEQAGRSTLSDMVARYPLPTQTPTLDYNAFVQSAAFDAAVQKVADAAAQGAIDERGTNELYSEISVSNAARIAAVVALNLEYATAARAARTELPLTGVFGPGSGEPTPVAELTQPTDLGAPGLEGRIYLPASHPTNPFRHRRHPDHTVGFDIQRVIRLDFDGEQGDALTSAGYGVDQVTGTYREEIFGLHKALGPDPVNSPIGLKTEGRFQLNRISFIDTLNTL